MKKTQVQIYLDREKLDRIAELASAQERSLSNMLLYILRRGMDMFKIEEDAKKRAIDELKFQKNREHMAKNG